MTRGVVRNPQDWIRDPRIAEVARASGWDDATGDLNLLAAIIAIESSGNTLARSEDSCVGLTQFHRRGNHALFDNSRWNGDIQGVFNRFGITRPQRGAAHEASWYNDPRASVIYAGFVLQDQFAQLRGARRNNLLLALQGYNGGTNDLRNPAAVEDEARQYPARVAAYLSYQAQHGTTEAIRDGNRRTLERLLADADAVGQRARIERDMQRYAQFMVNNEQAMDRQASGTEAVPRGFSGTVTPSSYLSNLLSGRVDAPVADAPVADASVQEGDVLDTPVEGEPPSREEGGFNLFSFLGSLFMGLISLIGQGISMIFGRNQEEEAPEPQPSEFEQGILAQLERESGVRGVSVHAALVRNSDAIEALQRALGNVTVDGRVRHGGGGETLDAWAASEFDANHNGEIELGELRALFIQRVGDPPEERAVS